MARLLSTARRWDHATSSTATRLYLTTEWVLILASNLRTGLKINDIGSCERVTEFTATTGKISSWALLLLVTVCFIVCNYESRSTWMSSLLYIVIFPISIAWRKCSPMSSSSPQVSMWVLSFQTSIVSYLYIFLQDFKPFGQWTPDPNTSIQLLGFVLSNSEPYLGLLHISLLNLARTLAGSSLNTVELSLVAQATSAFTIYYLRRSEDIYMPFQETFLFAFLYGLLFAVWPTLILLRKNVRLARMKPQHRPRNALRLRYMYALWAYTTITLVIITLVRSGLVLYLGQDPFLFIALYIWSSSLRISIVLYWATITTAGVIVVVYFWGSKPVGGLSNFPQSAMRLLQHSTKYDEQQSEAETEVFFQEENTVARRARALDRRRKFFHGLIVVLFLPTINLDRNLTYVALSLALVAFMFEEVLRVTVLPPFGLAIHKFLSGFTDHRDKAGHLVVSHLFLLVGVATPVWLTLTGEAEQQSASMTNTHKSIAMLSGVLTLGAGDAAASIIGKKFGRTKWPELQKSIEGTAAFIGAMLLGGLVAQKLSNEPSMINWPRFTVGVIATGLMEAVSTQNDNLIIPVFMWCLVF